MLKKLSFWLFICLLSCQQPEIISDRNYFSEHNIDSRLAYASSQRDSIILQGVYSLHNQKNVNQPTIDILKANRILMHRLCDSLHVEIGDYLKIHGHFQPIPTEPKSRERRCIHIDSFKVVKETHHLLIDARHWYSQNKHKLYDMLPQNVDPKSLVQQSWHVLVHKQKNNVIITLNMTGVLHRMDIQFVYDFDSSQLKKVYTDYQFKGE